MGTGLLLSILTTVVLGTGGFRGLMCVANKFGASVWIATCRLAAKKLFGGASVSR